MSTTTLTSWRAEYRRKTLGALVVSLVLHFLLILLVTSALSFRAPFFVPRPEEPPVELTIVEAPESKEKPEPSYVETSERQRTEKPPENAPFESDKDTQAASPLAPSGDAPVPTQDGRETPGLSFENKEYTAGPQARPSTPLVQPQEATAQAPEPKPEPTVEPKPTPKLDTELALLEPPKPKTTPRPEPEKAVQQRREQKQQVPQPPGYQPQTRITRIRGNISNRGRSAVSATATPLGRYKKMLSDAIGSRWYYYVSDNIALLNVGTVEIRFVVRDTGKVEKVEVLRNSSNESFAACSVRAIMEAEIPPIPKDLVPMLESGRIEIDYSFTILSN
jgi:outer membrane biosynthesis protein TonB